MSSTLPTIPLSNLLIAFAPSLLLLELMRRWSLDAREGLYANARMLIQLLLIGYVLNYLFTTNQPLLVVLVLVVMLTAAAWISLGPIKPRRLRQYLLALLALAGSGMLMLILVTQWVMDLPRWFEPRYVIPIAGMIFANAMNTVSLAAERFDMEQGRGTVYLEARGAALHAALIPQINALLAVGLVSLPGMMTGQILSGTDPLVAVRYQIMVMSMIFGSAGLAAAAYLILSRPTADQ